MYGLFGGCTTLLHLFVRHPILVLALGFSGLASQMPSNPGPGDRYGTDGSLIQLEQNIIREHPELAGQAVALRAEFDRLYKAETGSQARVLEITDACTDIQALNPDENREVAWLVFLDSYSRDGPGGAGLIFKRGPPTPPQKE